MSGVAGAPQSCKPDFAAHVTLITPLSGRLKHAFWIRASTITIINGEVLVNLIDRWLCCGVNKLTRYACSSQNCHGQTPHRPQARGTPAARCSQRASGTSRRSVVHLGGLLRSARCRTGQVRDGSARAGGRSTRQSQRGGVRLLAPVVLSSASEIGARGARGAGSGQAWPAQSAQVERGCDGLLASRTEGRSNARLIAVGGPGSGALRSQGPPSQHRACPGTPEKKTPVASPGAATLREDHSTVAAYEQLRTQVLEGAPFGGHFGLIVLLREGVAAWIARRSVCSTPTQPATGSHHGWVTPRLDDADQASIVRVLASMAMQTERRRGHDYRISPEDHS